MVLQPRYMPGVDNTSSAAVNCYITSALYGIVFLVALFYVKRYRAARRELIQGGYETAYQKLDQANSLSPLIMD